MRFWSLHPRYLDAKGLVALWREGLLARKVLLGETRGYRHHPQLVRFQESADPMATIDSYLEGVVDEAVNRNYRFDRSKITSREGVPKLTVSTGQIAFEYEHLRRKLESRDPERCRDFVLRGLVVHPLFESVDGPIASWERP